MQQWMMRGCLAPWGRIFIVCNSCADRVQRTQNQQTAQQVHIHHLAESCGLGHAGVLGECVRCTAERTQPWRPAEASPPGKTVCGPNNMIELDPNLHEFPILPLRASVLFPFQMMPISASRPASVAALRAAIESEDKTLVIASQLDPEVESPQFKDLFAVGTTAVVKRMNHAAGMVHALLQGQSRVRLLSAIQTDPYVKASVEILADPTDSNMEVEALHAEVMKLAVRAMDLIHPEANIQLEILGQNLEKPIHAAYLLGAIFSLGLKQEQEILESETTLAALKIMHEHLSHEVQVLELREKIAIQAATAIDKQQREFFLRQQLRAIKQELGEDNPEEAEASELRSRMGEVKLPENVQVEVEKELSRLERMSPAAPDFQIARTHIELILELPWQTSSKDILDLSRARKILDQDHFDLKDVKDRILEHLAVMKMNPEAKSPILCFVGPPGVGKTSLGQSIARALGRKFERMSLGGLHDEAELRGHRRTYIGAMPGRIIQAIRRSGVCNPLIMLDEVDKLGRDFRGDPASALMEILDPEQNKEFHDNYLDLPFDLTHVLFITTANTLDEIPRPLLDRMEVLRLPGYTNHEKQEIAKRYLIPRQVNDAGLTSAQLTLTDETLAQIIERYTREAGVRELERMIGRVARKVTTRFAEGNRVAVTIEPGDLPKLLGAKKFMPEQARRELRPGVAPGLAWTETGGEVLYVEVVLIPNENELLLTGQLGEVMRESASAARSYLLSHADSLGLQIKGLHKSGMHVHVPAGAVPKDGPSAGICMVTAMASLLRGVPARSDTAMTGEITLSGLVLPVGGIKEKLLAAHRAGFRRVILPRENKNQLDDLPDQVRAELEFEFAKTIEDVLEKAFVAEKETKTIREPALVG